MRWLVLFPLSLGACIDYQPTPQTRKLTTEQATFEPDIVAVNRTETVEVYLASVGQAPVTVYDISMEVTEGDAEDWVVLDTWKTQDEDGDGVNDSTEIAEGTEENPKYQLVEVSYRPKTAGRSRAVLTIESNDTEVLERVETEDGKDHGLWKVAIRGVAQYPCANVYPIFYDFGEHPSGSYWNTPITVENCGNVTLTVYEATVSGSSNYYIDSTFLVQVLAGSTTDLNVAWEPTSNSEDAAEIQLVTNEANTGDTISVIGNDCESSVDASWDADEDGWTECGGDCDDGDDTVSPETIEDETNGVDDDCDGRTDEGSGYRNDSDGDGLTEEDGDCDDNDATVYPGASETVNQIDDDCDDRIDEGSSRTDDDHDGFADREGDCDDRDETTYPGAEELFDTIDNDCDDLVDEGFTTFDDDEDGYADYDAMGAVDDCDDEDPWTYPEAQEDCDEVDNDCDGLIDEGADDTPEGACEFLATYREPETATTEGSTCATARGRASWAALALAGLLALRRRRR